MNYTMEELSELTTQWAMDRNIIQDSTPMKQYEKLKEEVKEIEGAYIELLDFDYNTLDSEQQVLDKVTALRNDVKLEIADAIIVLNNMAEMIHSTLHECFSKGYDKIKDRKGKLIRGVFYKEADLDNNGNPTR